MIDFSPEAWDRHRRGEFPEGGGAPAAYLPQGGGSWGGRTLPDTLSYSVSSASVSSLSSDRSMLCCYVVSRVKGGLGFEVMTSGSELRSHIQFIHPTKSRPVESGLKNKTKGREKCLREMRLILGHDDDNDGGQRVGGTARNS